MAATLLIAAFICAFIAPNLLAEDNDLNQQIRQRSFLGDGEVQDYVLGPGDLMEIKVFGVSEFNQSVRISSSGQVSLPFLGKVSIAGLTGAQVEEKLAELINAQNLIRDPQVSVFVSEYRSQPVFVLGAVNGPGQYMVTGHLTLIDVIALAGGLAESRAEDFVLVQRRESQSAGSDMAPEPLKIDLHDLLENGNLSLNIPVRGGDVIHVPEREIEFLFVIGEVGRPGVYEMEPGQELLISQALAWAGGTAKTAKSSEGMLVRYDQNGGRQELAVDFEAILKGRKPDFPVQADDIIFIPGSNFKTIGYGLLGVIPGTISSTATYSIRRPRQ